MKILHIIESLGRGGAERALTTNIKWLDAGKFTSTVCSLTDEVDFKGEIEVSGARVLTLGLRERADFKKGILELYNIMRRNKVDIVHTHLFFASVYGRIAAKLANVKCVVTTLHNPDYTYEDNGKLSFKVRKFLDKCTGGFVNTAFIAVSEAVKRDYIKWMGFENISVLYNSIDLNEFKPDPSLDLEKTRCSFGFRKDDFILLNIGRLHPQKGQLYLIDAMRLLKDRPGVNFKLLIIGEGPIRNELRVRIKDHNLEDRVYLMGAVKDVKPIIQMADVFVFPSIYEAQGVAAIEAMALEKPVIATSAEGLVEVITDGIDGLLVRPADSASLADMIMRLYNQQDLANKLACRARKSVEARFDIRRNVAILENFYERLLN